MSYNLRPRNEKRPRYYLTSDDSDCSTEEESDDEKATSRSKKRRKAGRAKIPKQVYLNADQPEEPLAGSSAMPDPQLAHQAMLQRGRTMYRMASAVYLKTTANPPKVGRPNDGKFPILHAAATTKVRASA